MIRYYEQDSFGVSKPKLMRISITFFLCIIMAAGSYGQLEYPTTQAAINPFLHPKEISANREIVLIYDSQNNNNYFTNQKFYDVNTLNPQDLNTSVALNTSMPVYPGIQSYGNRHIGQATGDFDNDGHDDYVVATEAPNNKINLGTYSAQAVAGNLSVVPGAQLQINGPLNSSTSSGESRPVGWIKLGCGDFDGDGDAEIVVLYRQHNTSLLTIELYDLENGVIVFKGSIQDETADVVGTGNNAFESFDMSIADLDFDGTSEIIIASSQVDAGSRKPYVKVYQLDDSGTSFTFVPKGKVFVSTTQASNSRMPVSLAVGDFNNDLIFEIALAYGFIIPNNSGSNPDTFIRNC